MMNKTHNLKLFSPLLSACLQSGLKVHWEWQTDPFSALILRRQQFLNFPLYWLHFIIITVIKLTSKMSWFFWQMSISFSTDSNAFVMAFVLRSMTQQSTFISVKGHFQSWDYLRSQGTHIWDKVRRHQLAAQRGSKGLKELTSCHSVCLHSLPILSFQVALLLFNVIWSSHLCWSNTGGCEGSQIEFLCCQHSFCQLEAHWFKLNRFILSNRSCNLSWRGTSEFRPQSDN